MATVEEATKCIQELNGVVCSSFDSLVVISSALQDLNGRRIRVDYSITERPHAPTPGEYMGHRRSRDAYSGRDRDRGDRDRDYRDRDRDRYSSRRDNRDKDRDRDRDPYGRDNRDWRDRRSPPPSKGGRYSPEYRRRRSYSRSPPRGSSPRPARDYEAQPASAGATAPASNAAESNPRW